MKMDYKLDLKLKTSVFFCHFDEGDMSEADRRSKSHQCDSSFLRMTKSSRLTGVTNQLQKYKI